MIEITREELIKEVRGERPDNATLFEDMLFFVKDSKDNGAVTTLRFDNGFGAMVFTPGGEAPRGISDDMVYAVKWPSNAKHISDYSVTHEPLGGQTNVKYSSYEEMRSVLRKIQAYDPAPF